MEYRHSPNVVVLGLPRGGVPVAAKVARSLGTPLDVFVVRKLGVSGREELAMGAIASGSVQVRNEGVIDRLHISEDVINTVIAAETAELRRRELAYRGERPPLEVTGRTVILVDDGLATGSTMRAAVAAVRPRDPEAVVVAVPTAAEATLAVIAVEVDALVVAHTPEPFSTFGHSYLDFAQITDDTVRRLLREGD